MATNRHPPAYVELLRRLDDLERKQLAINEVQNEKIATLEMMILKNSPSAVVGEFLSPKQYAHASGLSVQGVHSRIRKGTIRNEKRGGRRLIPRAELAK